jgi:hypothetical protein
VDLRRNGGGNMWPMLSGLRPLVGEAVLGSFEGRSGKSKKWTATTEGGVGVETPAALRDVESAWVAVPTGTRTGRSGEFVTIAFRGRPRAAVRPADGGPVEGQRHVPAARRQHDPPDDRRRRGADRKVLRGQDGPRRGRRGEQPGSAGRKRAAGRGGAMAQEVVRVREELSRRCSARPRLRSRAPTPHDCAQRPLRIPGRGHPPQTLLPPQRSTSTQPVRSRPKRPCPTTTARALATSIEPGDNGGDQRPTSGGARAAA